MTISCGFKVLNESEGKNFSIKEINTFGDKRINRLSVFTLPDGMIQFYKVNIEYITGYGHPLMLVATGTYI